MESANLLSPEDKEKCKISPTLLGRQNAQSPLPWEQGKNTKLPAHLRQRGKLRLSPLQGREACAPPAQRARKTALSLTLLGRQNAQSPLPCEQGKNTKLPAHLRQVKQQSLTHLFSAESLGFPRSRVGKRALHLPKEQGRVCTLPCLREGSFTLQGGAHFWSLHPPPALNISSPTPGMFGHFAELIYARLYLINLLHSAWANRIFSINVSSLTSICAMNATNQRTLLTNERFDPTYSSVQCLWLPPYPYPRLTELGPLGNRIYRISSSTVLLRVVLDLLRVVRDLLRVVRVFTSSFLHCPYL
ncbi:hypothetical protein T4C_5141 [Trichinella pseudospiralis]|uniref:Uncharacterized protein n=1 Tax=Trichinella pseudospiralis TaxID=6337 RepID=A0A0V1JSC0_TRIPS|nr:hypothetical protein T4C_5141 [Trichinella pseudospiralis]